MDWSTAEKRRLEYGKVIFWIHGRRVRGLTAQRRLAGFASVLFGFQKSTPWQRHRFNMEQKLIAVTGGTGQIGSALVRQLIRDGARVRVLLRNPAVRRMLPEGVECFRGCLPHSVPHEFVMGCTTVVHLAAVVPRTRPVAPDEMKTVNIGSLSALLTLARQYGVQRLMYISSARVLNSPERSYFSPYLYSKKAAEAYLNQSMSSPTCLIVYLPTVLSTSTEAGTSLARWVIQAVRRRWVMGPARPLPFHLIALDDVVTCIRTFIHDESLSGAWVLPGHCVTIRQLVTIAEQLTGRSIKYIPVPIHTIHQIATFISRWVPRDRPSRFWLMLEKLHFLSRAWTLTDIAGVALWPYAYRHPEVIIRDLLDMAHAR